MTLYLNESDKNLKESILYSDDVGEFDQIIIISGYLGLEPLNELSKLGVNSTVVFGMYPTEGVDLKAHKIYQQFAEKNLDVMYSTSQEVHSKIYVWKKDEKVLKILVGSANFTNVALVSENREILVEVDSKDYQEVMKYVDNVIFNSTSSLNMDDSNLRLRTSKSQSGSTLLESDEDLLSSKNRVCILSLLDKSGNMPAASGLNWGQSEKGNVNPNDSYISIRVQNIRAFPEIFPEKAMISENQLGKKSRQNDPVDVIFDDNTIMSCLLEGSQNLDGKTYPNKLSSFPKKSDLGKYFRSRLGKGDGEKITKKDLIDYGRTDVYMQKIGQDQYYIDFSKDK